MQTHPDSIVFTLPEVMTAETSEAVTQALLQLPLATPLHLELDSSQVVQFSTCGAQVLLALDRSIKAAEGSWRLTGDNSIIPEILKEIGLGWLVTPLR